MPLNEDQYQVGSLLMGAGTVYTILDIQGFGLGDKRDRRYEIPGADGEVWGREYRNGPTVTFEGQIASATPAAAVAALKALRTAFDGTTRTSPRTTQTFTYRLPGDTEQTVQGRPAGLRVALNRLGVGVVPFTATFDCKTQLT